jgi:hypothetical protein
MELSKNTLLATRGSDVKGEKARQPSSTTMTLKLYPKTHRLGSAVKQSTTGLVPFLLRTVAAPTVHINTTATSRLSDDLVAVQKAAKVIRAAVDDGTITSSEADAVLALLTENFTARRINKIFERVADPHLSQHWFLTTRFSSSDE